MMRIKYIYQLLLSQMSIIVIAFIILSSIFSHYVETLVYENKVNELNSYAEAILFEYHFEKSLWEKERILSQYSRVLRTQGIYFSLFDSEGRVVSRILGGPPKFKLNEDEWAQITNGETVVVKRDLGRFDQDVSLVALPQFINGELAGGILLVSPVSGSKEMIRQMNQYLLYTVFIALLVSLLLSIFLSKLHVRRIQRIRKAVSMIAKGNYDTQVPSSNFDEIGDLANDFNQMTRKLKSSQEEIDALENRRKQFIADVSHELRTPLTTISGVIEGIKNEMIPEEEKEKGIQLVSNETKRLIRLVNENLDYENIRSNQVTLYKQNILLAEVFEIIREHLALQLEEKQNEIVINIQHGTMVYADYDRLIQILMNITKNSIQFTENGTIWLKGKTECHETVIEIEDTGIGIDANEIEQIWHRFYKADLSRKNNPFGGFGLGLAIVKQLVQLHQGEINVFSQKGQGTKFVIRLPHEASVDRSYERKNDLRF